MSAILSLSLASLWSRRLTAGLTVFAIAVSVMLLLGVEKLRHDAKASFAATISGTDLIVGARGGATQLLLYSVFRLGDAPSSMSWRSYQDLAGRPGVAWTVPLSLGDSHRGYRVLGTSNGYFEHYRYGRRQPLEIVEGRRFQDVFDIVLGAEVASTLDYKLGDEIVVTHGVGAAGLDDHDDMPFRVSGILARTGTPVDRTLHVSLDGIEAIHVNMGPTTRSGTQLPGTNATAEEVREMDLTPRTITAFLLGLESKFAIFEVQRAIRQYPREPLMAILPGVALQNLWSLMGTAEAALLVVSGFVVLAGLLGMTTVLIAGLNERRREMAILRAVGARPGHVFALLVAEAAMLAALGAAAGTVLHYGLLLAASAVVESRFGLFLEIGWPGPVDLAILAGVTLAGAIAGLAPALLAYRRSLSDGMRVG